MQTTHSSLASDMEDELDNLQCAICLELLCQPLRLPCCHSFCRACLSAAFHSEKRCPLCRTAAPIDFNPDEEVVDQPLEYVLKRKCTVEYNQRLQETAASAARRIQLRIGNRYEITGNWKIPHKWTIFVEMGEACSGLDTHFRLADLVEKVRFTLVPACNLVSVVSGTRREPEVHNAPFEVTGTSWGLFTVHLEIVWKSWLALPCLSLSHELAAAGDNIGWNHGVDLGPVAELVAKGLPMDSSQISADDLEHGTAETENDLPSARATRLPKAKSACKYFSSCFFHRRTSVSPLCTIHPTLR